LANWLRLNNMHIALFILYSIACGYGLVKLPWVRKTGIRPPVLLALFVLHVAVGCLHNVIAWRYYPGHGDIWDDYQWSLVLRKWLLTDPNRFLLFNSKWTYVTHNGIIFIQLLFNFFSADNIYINTVLFNFFLFLGNAGLYQVFRRHFPADPLTALTAFLLPSTLFWTSCIHREGVIYLLLGLFFYEFDRVRQARSRIFALMLFLLLLYFRFTIALLLLPALLAGLLTEQHFALKYRLIPAAALAAAILIIPLAFPALTHLVITGLTGWQAEFQVLEGHSRLYLPSLDGTWTSLLRVFPYALRNGLFEPLPGSGGRPIYLAFSIELILIWMTALAALVILRQVRTGIPRPTDSVPHRDGFPPLFLTFSILGMIFVGTFVPFAGAIVRYRSLFLPFLLAPALHSLHHLPFIQRINNKLQFFI